MSGFGLVLLGTWGAIIAFIGPYWDYAYTPNSTWTWTAARGWLEVLPGCVTLLAGLVILTTKSRLTGSTFALLGIAAGAWFVIGPLVAPLWDTAFLGTPVGDTTDVSVEQIGIFFGLGAAISILAAFALGRFWLAAARDVSGLPPSPAVTQPDAPESMTTRSAMPTASNTEHTGASAAEHATDPPAAPSQAHHTRRFPIPRTSRRRG